MPKNINGNGQGWLSRQQVTYVALAIVTLLAVYLCYLIVQPFIPAIAVAAAVAIATKRVHDELRSRLGRTAAAAVGTLLVTFLVFGPLTLLITYLVRQIIEGVKELQAGGGMSEWRTIVALPPAVDRALEWAEVHLNLQENLQRLGQLLVGKAGAFLAGSVNVVTQVVFVLFVLFFLYRDRDQVIKALRSLMPLSDEETSRMFRRIEATILATVNGSLTVAFVQAVLAGIMYTILGVPVPVVWAAATFLVALVPVFGTVLVWGPMAIFLLLSGNWVKAIILVAWGAAAVGTIDNILYPYLVGDRLRLHTLPTFFSIIGGVSLFGPAGLILGPIVLAVTLGLLDIWLRRSADLPTK